MKPDDMRPDESCEEYINRIQKEDPKLMVIALQSACMMVYKKIPTKDQLFDLWFQENCQSDEIQLEFNDHKLELQQMGEDIPSYRDWAIEKFNQLLEINQIDLENIDLNRILDR